MLRLRDIELDPETTHGLSKYQRMIDAISDYSGRVDRAKDHFKRYNRPANAVFSVVRSRLREMCGELQRCCYCEDAPADEVEHILPKEFYPELTFEWMNYLFACGPCNSPKGASAAVVTEAGGLSRIARRKGDPVLPPPGGAPALINPRVENPLDFLELDLVDTFYFSPIPDLALPERLRAEYTIELLRLNDRDMLPRARRNAYLGYVSRLEQYRTRRDEGATDSVKLTLEADLRRTPHPTVWAEMRRQRGSHPELHELFSAVPEALDW